MKVVVRKEFYLKKEYDILSRLVSIEATTEEIYKEIIKIKKDFDDKKFEQMSVMVRLENIADFFLGMDYATVTKSGGDDNTQNLSEGALVKTTEITLSSSSLKISEKLKVTFNDDGTVKLSKVTSD